MVIPNAKLRVSSDNRSGIVSENSSAMEQAWGDLGYAVKPLPPKLAKEVHGQGGAGFLFVCMEDATVLLLRRSGSLDNGNTWGMPGGPIGDGTYDDHDPKIPKVPLSLYHKNAILDVKNNLGSFPKSKPIDSVVYHSGNWKYIAFVAEVTAEEKADWTKKFFFKDKKNTKAQWFNRKEIPSPLNPITKFTFKYFMVPDAPEAPPAPKVKAPEPPPVVKAPEPEPTSYVAPTAISAPKKPQSGSLAITQTEISQFKKKHTVTFISQYGKTLTWTKMGVNKWSIAGGPNHSTKYVFKTLLKAKKILSSQTAQEAQQAQQAAPDPFTAPSEPPVKTPDVVESKKHLGIVYPSKVKLDTAPLNSTVKWDAKNIPYFAVKKTTISWAITKADKDQGIWSVKYLMELMGGADDDPVMTLSAVKPPAKLPSSSMLTDAPPDTVLTWTTEGAADKWTATKQDDGVWLVIKSGLTKNFGAASKTVLAYMNGADDDPVLKLPPPKPAAPPKPAVEIPSKSTLDAAEPGSTLTWTKDSGTKAWKAFKKSTGNWLVTIDGTPGATTSSLVVIDYANGADKDPVLTLAPGAEKVPLKLPTKSELSEAEPGSTLVWTQDDGDGPKTWKATKKDYTYWKVEKPDGVASDDNDSYDVLDYLTEADQSPVLTLAPHPPLVPSITKLEDAPLGTVYKWTKEEGKISFIVTKLKPGTWQVTRNGTKFADSSDAGVRALMDGVVDATPVKSFDASVLPTSKAPAEAPPPDAPKGSPTVADLDAAPAGSTISAYPPKGLKQRTFTKQDDGKWTLETKYSGQNIVTSANVVAFIDADAVANFPTAPKTLYSGELTEAELEEAPVGSTVSFSKGFKWVKKPNGKWAGSSGYDIPSADITYTIKVNDAAFITTTDFPIKKGAPATSGGFSDDAEKNKDILKDLPVGALISFMELGNIITASKTPKGDFAAKKIQEYSAYASGEKISTVSMSKRLAGALGAGKMDARLKVLLPKAVGPKKAGPANGFFLHTVKNRAVLKKLPVGTEITFYSGAVLYRYIAGLKNFLFYEGTTKKGTVSNIAMAKALADAVELGEEIEVIKIVPPPTLAELDKAPVYSYIKVMSSWGEDKRYIKQEDGTWQLKGGGNLTPEMLTQKLLAALIAKQKLAINFEVDVALLNSVIPLDESVVAPIQISAGFHPKMSQAGGISLKDLQDAVIGNTLLYKSPSNKISFYTKRPSGKWVKAGDRYTKFSDAEIKEIFDNILKKGEDVGTRSYEAEPPKTTAPAPVDPYKYVVQFGIQDAVDKRIEKNQAMFQTAKAEMEADIEEHLVATRGAATSGYLPSEVDKNKFYFSRSGGEKEARISYDYIAEEAHKDPKKLQVLLQGYRVGLSYMKDLKKRDPDMYQTHRSKMSNWRGSSSSLWCLQAYCQQRGMSAWDMNDDETQHKRDCMKDPSTLIEDATYFNDVYTFTQAYFKWAGIKTLTLFRGVKYQLDSKPPNLGDPVLIPSRTFTSWSGEPGIATRFGRVVRAEVPVENIWASPLTDSKFGQAEVRLINSEGAVETGWETEFMVMGASNIMAYVMTDIDVIKGSYGTEADWVNPWKKTVGEGWEPKSLKTAQLHGQMVYILEQDADNDNWMQILRAEDELRQQVLKVAQERPDLRRHLLPLLRKLR